MKKKPAKKADQPTEDQRSYAMPPIRNIKDKAMRLMRLVDRATCGFDYLLDNLDEFEEQFESADLKRSDLTPELIARARKLDQEETERLERFNARHRKHSMTEPEETSEKE